jgi:glutamate-1-semialdehyde aminotransferase
VSRSEGIDLIDIDNQRLMDISGSYGVNVCGTERYKKFLKGAIESVGDLGLVLGPVHPLLAENIKLLKTISRKQEVRWKCFFPPIPEYMLVSVMATHLESFTSAYSFWDV